MYSIETTNRFEKNYIQCKVRGYNMDLLDTAIEILEKYGKLPDEYKSHKLKNNWNGYWECHIVPDWLLIWKKDKKKLVLH
ncbi:MAG: type II toxin-antitoxin system YafQ family toxin [Prevotellaceae bacterium]|jgi:mRNA interferase YafQ|nr:type II toxin-antitoxin system YafQ family toxin [Prevotellaceae bacterium]